MAVTMFVMKSNLHCVNIQIRDRRSTPNFVSIAFQTLEVLVEDIKQGEFSGLFGANGHSSAH